MISNKELTPFNYFLHTNYFSAIMVGIEGPIRRGGPSSHMSNTVIEKQVPIETGMMQYWCKI